MSRLVDPTICPDCRARLDSAATCTACGLEVAGPLAADLWRHMVAADGIVEQLRALSGRALATSLVPATAPKISADDLPTFPRPATARPQPKRLPSASVPVVLLSLGALCLLVAAVVFVAVAWDALGLTGRTLVLLAVTTLLSLVAVVLTRKNLRGAAETFWLVVAGMLTVDLLGAQSAGLAGLDALDWRGTGVLVGTALLAMGLAVAAWAIGQPVGRLYGAQAVAVGGALVVCSTNVWFAANPAVACTIAVPVLSGLFVLLRRPVPVAAYGVGALALATWLALLLTGWDRALETVSLGDWWSDLRGWPLLAAALLAAATVYVPKVPVPARPLAAGLALLSLVLLADAPATDGTQTRDLVIGSCVLLTLGLLAAAAPKAWAIGAGVLASLGVLGLGLMLTIEPWDVLAGLGYDGAGPIDLTLLSEVDGAAAWTAGMVSLAIAATMVLLLRQVPATQRLLATQCVRSVAPAVIALGGLGLVLRLEPPLWAGVLAGALASAVAGAAAWWVREHPVAGWVGAATTSYLVVVTLRTASVNDLLLAVMVSVLAASLVAVHALRERSAGSHLSAAVPGALAALSAGWALVAWGNWFGTDDGAIAVSLAVYAGLVALAAAPVTKRPTSRVTFEVSAIVLGLGAVALPENLRDSAMALTIIGSAICLLAVARRDREVLSWFGAGVLGVATVLRVALDVRAPELYTLPAAVVLVAFGVWRLRTDPKAESFMVLGSGLTLGLLPSLLLALEEPVSLRGALIGAAGVLVLMAGVQQRLAAPFVLGAVTTGLLAVRHLQPYADAIPRWVSLGGVGLALLLVGVTWEARRHNLETAGRYLADLR